MSAVFSHAINSFLMSAVFSHAINIFLMSAVLSTSSFIFLHSFLSNQYAFFPSIFSQSTILFACSRPNHFIFACIRSHFPNHQDFCLPAVFTQTTNHALCLQSFLKQQTIWVHLQSVLKQWAITVPTWVWKVNKLCLVPVFCIYQSVPGPLV